MDDELNKELRDHAWRHFSLHADQRLKAFNFYLIIATIVGGGMLGIAKDLKRPEYAAPFGFLLALLSFVFWKLDRRTRHLIRQAENALKHWEDELGIKDSNNCPHAFKVFQREEHETKLLKNRPRRGPFGSHLTYSECFGIIFVVIGLTGFIVGLMLSFSKGA